jgi:ribosomal subunit interface protein
MVLLNKKFALLALASMAAGSQGFMTSRPTNSAAFWTSSRPSLTPLSVASDVMGSVPIEITGNNVPLTDSLQEYVNEKFDKTMSKFAESKLVKEVSCHVNLSVNKNPSVADGHTCEVVSMIAGGPTIRVEESSADMYTSIDLVSDRLGRKLRKFKERKLDGYHGKFVSSSICQFDETNNVCCEKVKHFASQSTDIEKDLAIFSAKDLARFMSVLCAKYEMERMD